MIYTAEKFAAHLESRGATVTTTDSAGFTVLGATYGGVGAAAYFVTGGQFDYGMVSTPDTTSSPFASRVDHTRSLKRIVDALGLPAAQPAHR